MTTSDDEKEFSHESYGQVGFHRVQGSSGRLFGSSLPNQGSFITLRIGSCVRKHHLGRDWYHGSMRGDMIEVDLSAAQFAELITTMNVGTGTPCTIRRFNGKRMEDPPNELLEAEQVRTDFKEKVNQSAEKMLAYQKQIDAILDKPGAVSKKDREEIREAIGMIVQDVRANMPYWLRSFVEATGKVVTAAKAEVDAFMTNAVIQAGKEALGMGESPFREPEQLPAKGTK